MNTTGIDEAAALAAIERCEKIEWQFKPEHLRSSLALMREYLRRAAVVAEVLGCPNAWPWDDAASRLTLPGVDQRFLPAYVYLGADQGLKYEKPAVNSLEDKVAALARHFSDLPSGPDRFSPNFYALHSCWWYIRWASVKNLPPVAALNSPDPYEPLIVLYERGGYFRVEHGFIDFDPTGTLHPGSPAQWITREPLPSLAPAALDALDREGAAPERKI